MVTSSSVFMKLASQCLSIDNVVLWWNLGLLIWTAKVNSIHPALQYGFGKDDSHVLRTAMCPVEVL